MFDLIESISKDRPGVKLFTPADAFVSSMVELMGAKDFAGVCGISEKQLSTQLVRLKGRVVYTDPGNETVANYLLKGAKEPKFLKRFTVANLSTKEGESATSSGTPGNADAPTDGPKEVAEGAIMQFQNVLTSKSQDRDGDILDPMGANIDPKSPLLWQHMPMMPCGKLVKTLAINEQMVATECAIAGTQLGKDAALLVEFGGLRISHGFVPVDYDQRKDANGNSLPGWDIKRYNVLEVSLVSIPSNPDAVITAFSKGKLESTFAKSWGEALHRKRAPIVNGVNLSTLKTAEGTDLLPQGVNVNLTINMADAVKGKKGTKAGDEDEIHAGDDDAGDDETPAGTTAGEGDDDAGDDEGEGAKGDLSDLMTGTKALAEGEALPQEAKDRLSTAMNMIAGVDTAVGESGDVYKAAADSRNIGEMLMVAYGVVDAVMAGIKNACEEIERATMVEGLDEAQQASVDELYDRASGLWSQVAAAAGYTEDGEEDVLAEDGETASANPIDEEYEPEESMPMASFERAFSKLSELVIEGELNDDQKAAVKDLAGAF